VPELRHIVMFNGDPTADDCVLPPPAKQRLEFSFHCVSGTLPVHTGLALGTCATHPPAAIVTTGFVFTLGRTHVIAAKRVNPVGVGTAVTALVPPCVKASRPVAFPSARTTAQWVFFTMLSPEFSSVAQDEGIALAASLNPDPIAAIGFRHTFTVTARHVLGARRNLFPTPGGTTFKKFTCFVARTLSGEIADAGDAYVSAAVVGFEAFGVTLTRCIGCF
jgi:hypothetical protein